MKKLFMGMGLATALLAGNAFGETLQVVGACGTFVNAPNSTTALIGSFLCPTAASLGISGTVTGEFIVYDSDFSNPNGLTETEVTNWSFTGGTVAFSTDTTTSTEGTGLGAGTSTQATSTAGNTFEAAQLDSENNLIKAGFDNNVSSPFGAITVNYTNSSTPTNTAASLTGYAQVVYEGSNLTTTTPEPFSMLLVGSGLVAVSFLRRRKSSSVSK